MKCRNCGERVAFTDSRCLHCHADRRQEYRAQVIAFACASVFGLFGSALWGVPGAVGGLVVGAVAGIMLALTLIAWH